MKPILGDTPAAAGSDAAEPADQARRRLLLAGVGAVAGLGGAGMAWWKSQRESEGPVAAGVEASLWTQSFDTPSGPALAMASLRGGPLILNFWATWCPPCVEELPLLDRFFREQAAKNWKVLGLAIDQPSAVRGFLQKTPVSFPVALAGLTGTDLGKSLGNTGGGLPFTVVFGADGRVAHRKMGRLTPDDLQRWAAPAS